MEQILNTKKATVIADRYVNELTMAMSDNDSFTIARLVDFYRAISGICEIGTLPQDVDDHGLATLVAHNIHNKCASLLEDGYDQIVAFRKALQTEDKVDVFLQDECKWYNAKIVDTRSYTINTNKTNNDDDGDSMDEETTSKSSVQSTETGKEIYVKFKGWPDKYNIWISVDDNKHCISPSDSKTNKKHALWMPRFLRDTPEKKDVEESERENDVVIQDETSDEAPSDSIREEDGASLQESGGMSRSGRRSIMTEKLTLSQSHLSKASSLSSSPTFSTNNSNSSNNGGSSNITTCIPIESVNAKRGPKSGSRVQKGRTFGGMNQVSDDTVVVEAAEAEDDNDWVRTAVMVHPPLSRSLHTLSLSVFICVILTVLTSSPFTSPLFSILLHH